LASTNANFLFEKFIKSRRQGVNAFLSNLKYGNAKRAYYRANRALCNWAVKEGYLQENPITNKVESQLDGLFTI
jgi:hypothetical protein